MDRSAPTIPTWNPVIEETLERARSLADQLSAPGRALG
jgi:hypothetical protein